MKHYIWISVKTKDSSQVLLKLFKTRIEVFETKYLPDSLQFKILSDDYKKLKKIFRYQFHLERHEGYYHLKEVFRTKWLVFLGIILFLFFLFFVSHIMIDVQVIHSNKEIRDLVEKSLSNYGIEKLTWKKSFHEIEQIKKNILDQYPNQLEWLEIEVDGMRYIIRVEERIITKKEEQKERCHLIATKSAIVKRLKYSVGDAKVMINDFVKEGDLLISGELVANEKVTEQVCATGEVLGEVWYTTKVSLPMTYESKKETGKTRWNFMISKGQVDTLIFRPRVEKYVNEKKLLFSLFGYEIYFVIQKEVTVTEEKYSENEALQEALRLVDEKMKQKMKEQEEIIDKKVLKKNVNNSTMDIEVFVSMLEIISRQEEFQEELEEG